MEIEIKVMIKEDGSKEAKAIFYPISEIDKEEDFDKLIEFINKSKAEFLSLRQNFL